VHGAAHPSLKEKSMSINTETLSGNIEFIQLLGIPPAKSVLAQWQHQAKKLEEALSARDGDVAHLSKVLGQQSGALAECQRMNENQEDTIKARDATIDRLKRIVVENENVVDLKQRITELGKCNANQSRIIDDLRGEVHDLKRQLDNQAKVFLGRINGLHAECSKLEKQRDEMRTALGNATVRYAEAELQAKQVAAQTTAPTFATVPKLNYDTLMALHDNQKQTIEKYQKKVRDLVERLEAERTKVGPAQDLYKDAKLEVRLLNDGVVEVLEYGAPGQHSRLRSTTEVVDLRTKVARRG